MEITLGPVLFEWRQDEITRFYEEAARMDVDRVYVGEVVCAKKTGLRLGDIEAMKRSTRRYAKRQLTWLRKLPGAHRVDLTDRTMTILPWIR